MNGDRCVPDMELGHLVTGSMGHLGHLSRPGHRVTGSSFCKCRRSAANAGSVMLRANNFNFVTSVPFTARCYASAVLAMGLCLSVCHKSEFYRNG